MPRWPPGRNRTRSPERARFDPHLSIAAAIRDLLDELRRIQATDVRIDYDLQLRRDGLPYSQQRQPEDQGVVAYFTLPGGRKVCMPCDQWDRIQHNIRAIARTLEAKRAIERWGTATQEAEYEGYLLLGDGRSTGVGPAAFEAPSPQRAPHEVLGVQPDAPAEVIRAVQRTLMLVHHPDRGGDRARAAEINAAAKAMLEALPP
jgi:hypothetical protein